MTFVGHKLGVPHLFLFLGVGVCVLVLPMTGFPNWRYVAILANFLEPVKLSERKYFCE